MGTVVEIFPNYVRVQADKGYFECIYIFRIVAPNHIQKIGEVKIRQELSRSQLLVFIKSVMKVWFV